MGWLLRDERNMRLHRPPAQHHEPPLGCVYPDWEGGLIRGDHIRDKDGFCNICGDCGWTPEGEWVPCSMHPNVKESK